ncbi:MAG: magnesium transporter CorA family protein [Nevskiales bacterium]|nr:magnesium transporter CorA family protein [Nevskiales bacterium]
MKLYHFAERQRPVATGPQGPLPEDGFLWLDLERDDAAGWPERVSAIVSAPIDPQHLEDSLNPAHPSFFDGTSDYDMVVFQGLGPDDRPLPIEPRSAAFFVFDRLLVTVRAVDSVSIGRVRQRLLDGRLKSPGSAFRLAQLMLDAMVDRYLAIREPIDAALSEMQDGLLDPGSAMDDWRCLLDARRQVRRLQSVAETQFDALEAWHRDSRFEWEQSDEVRYRDLTGHVDRVLNHATSLERDLESAVQLHFAAVAHRTNRVMQALTVLSAVFFPLTLIVGIYGMNFDNMPELHWRYGYFIVLGVLAGIGATLLLLFRRRGLF